MVGEILGISVDMQTGSIEHWTELFECFNNAEQFLFDGCVFFLGRSEFSRVVSNRSVVLFDNCP